MEALEAKDAAKARETFLRERATCMACHVAENMAFLNDTPARLPGHAAFPKRN